VRTPLAARAVLPNAALALPATFAKFFRLICCFAVTFEFMFTFTLLLDHYLMLALYKQGEW
jgi:hypothetical protein